MGLVAAALSAGCGAAPDSEATGPLTVYLSAPLRGAAGEDGRDIRDGAELALEEAGGKAGDVAVVLEVLDDTDGAANGARWSPAEVARNARAAAQDTSTVAYIGDFESGATRVSLPITNQAIVPQISPASTALDLVSPPDGGTEVPQELQPGGERTFLRVIPDDGAQAEAAAAWARELKARRAVTLSDGSEFGDLVVEEFSETATGLGIEVVEAGGGRGAAELVYLGASGDGAETPRPAGAGPLAGLMSTDALLLGSDFPAAPGPGPPIRLTAAAQDPEQLPAAGQDLAGAFEHEYGRPPGPYAAYGFEAMALVLDAIEGAGADAEDRRAVLDELLATSDRDSVLGTYSITAVGNTTLDALAGYRIVGGEPVFERALRVP